jgi:hypothetical protein
VTKEETEPIVVTKEETKIEPIVLIKEEQIIKIEESKVIESVKEEI